MGKLIIAVRGSSGVVTWSRFYESQHIYAWVCGRDGFSVMAPEEDAQAEASLRDIVTHSAQLVGSVAQIVQFEL